MGIAAWLWLCCVPVVYCAPISSNATHQADRITIAVLLSGSNPLYQQTLQAFGDNLPPNVDIATSMAEDWSGEAKSDLVVAIGASATKKMFTSNPMAPGLSILLPSNTFTRLLEHSQSAANKLKLGKISAIYMDQPGERQINLAKYVDPGLKNLGTLYDAQSSSLIKALDIAANEKGVKLLARQLEQSENPVAALREMYADIDMFIAVPGRFIFNRSTAKWMLYLSYRHRKPLLGFSADYVQSGALAAVYSRPSDIGLQAASWIKAIDFRDIRLPPPSHPNRFSVSINREIAQRLGKDLPSDNDIKQILQELERQR